MKARPILTVLGLAAVGVAAYATPAHAANCGGQGAAPQPVPYTCTLPGIDITVSGITRHFSAVVSANGTSVTAVITMTGGLLPVNVPVKIVHHEGISGAGGNEDSAQGFILAGQTTATVVDSSPCRAGQLDVKAVDTSPGSGDKFRIGGPWITNGTGCMDTQTTVPATTVASTVPAVTTPGAPTTAPTVPATDASRITALPATGTDLNWFIVSTAALLFFGAVLVVTGRRGES
jgi:hypothetical protein